MVGDDDDKLLLIVNLEYTRNIFSLEETDPLAKEALTISEKDQEQRSEKKYWKSV